MLLEVLILRLVENNRVLRIAKIGIRQRYARG